MSKSSPSFGLPIPHVRDRCCHMSKAQALHKAFDHMQGKANGGEGQGGKRPTIATVHWQSIHPAYQNTFENLVMDGPFVGQPFRDRDHNSIRRLSVPWNRSCVLQLSGIQSRHYCFCYGWLWFRERVWCWKKGPTNRQRGDVLVWAFGFGRSPIRSGGGPWLRLACGGVRTTKHSEWCENRDHLFIGLALRCYALRSCSGKKGRKTHTGKARSSFLETLRFL
jgi:hypothetical protein